MNNFSQQLQATRDNLSRLEKLAQEAPDLFGHAHLVCVNPEKVDVYIHASVGDEAQTIDWPSLARKYRRANWQREQSAAYPSNRYDWDGTLEGVKICIIGAESKPQPTALEFA